MRWGTHRAGCRRAPALTVDEIKRVVLHMNALAKRKEDWGQLGPEMRALANDKQRAFVENYLLETYTNGHKNNYGAQVNAARMAGFGGEKATPHQHRKDRLAADARRANRGGDYCRRAENTCAR